MREPWRANADREPQPELTRSILYQFRTRPPCCVANVVTDPNVFCYFRFGREFTYLKCVWWKFVGGNPMLRVRDLIALGSLLSGLAATPSQAAMVLFDASKIGEAVTIDYNGFATPDGSDGVFSGLSARTVITLTSIVDSTLNFSYSVSNTSGGAVSSSRVSIFGFDVTPHQIGQSATGEFNIIGTGNTPNLTGSDVNRICFKTGGGTNNCAGGGGDGVDIGEAASTGTFSLSLSPGGGTIGLDRFFVRYQSLVSTTTSEQSATGLGTVVTNAVPEPSTWAMMIGGFASIGGAMRYRRRKVTFA